MAPGVRGIVSKAVGGKSVRTVKEESPQKEIALSRISSHLASSQPIGKTSNFSRCGAPAPWRSDFGQSICQSSAFGSMARGRGRGSGRGRGIKKTGRPSKNRKPDDQYRFEAALFATLSLAGIQHWAAYRAALRTRDLRLGVQRTLPPEQLYPMRGHSKCSSYLLHSGACIPSGAP